MATTTKTADCEHLMAGTCDACVRRLTDRADGLEARNARLREQVKQMGDQIDGFGFDPRNADALAAMLPEEGFDLSAPPGTRIRVTHYRRPPQCRVEITLPGGVVETVDLRDLPRKYTALRAGK